MADKNEQTTDDQIASELASSATANGDSTGSAVQAGLASGDPNVALDGSTPNSGLGAAAAQLAGNTSAVLPANAIAGIPGVDLPNLAKIGGSYKGPTEAGKKYAAGLFGEADRKTDAYDAKDQARIDEQMAQSGKDYAKAEEAAGQVGEAAKSFGERDAELQQRVVDFNNHAALLEQKAADEAKAERAKYLSAYQEQLSAVKALAMQSGNPMESLNTGGKLGLIGAEFAQGFLAARGINIDVSGQVDRWVDRSIKEHQMKIQNMRASAEDQLHLYEIARQNSQDDWEARQRYRGFVIQGLQTSIQANANRFQSDIAVARANESVAKLQIEANQTLRQIGDAHEARVLQYKHAVVTEAAEQGKLAIQQAHLQLEKDKAAAAQKAQPAPLYVTDPRATQRVDGKVKSTQIVGQIDPNLKPEVQNEVKKQVDAAATTYGQVGTAFDRLRQLREPAFDSYKARFGKKAGEMFDQDYRAYKREATAAMMDARHAIAGSNLTENEKKEWDSLLPDEKEFQKGNNNAAIDQLEMHFRDKYLSTVNNVSGIIPAQGQKPYIDVGNDTSANYNARMSRNVAQTGTIATEEGQAARGSDKNDAKDTPAFQDFEKTWNKDHSTYFAAGAAPHWTTPMNNIARAAVDPVAVMKEHKSEGEDPKQVQSDAMERLKYMSDDKSITSMRREYAKFLLQQLETDPQGVLSELQPVSGDLKFH